MLESTDLHTETFTNSKGWTVVRVTHRPTGLTAARQRSKALVSSVQAQSECIAELRDRVGTAVVPEAQATTLPSPAAPVTRAEFEALAARVTALERLLPSTLNRAVTLGDD